MVAALHIAREVSRPSSFAETGKTAAVGPQCAATAISPVTGGMLFFLATTVSAVLLYL